MSTGIRKRPFRKTIAAENDTAILSFGKGDCLLIKLLSGGTSQVKFGAIRHNDIIGKPYGSRIKASHGHVYILALDPLIWSTALPHRTQIIYPTDASMIVGRLDLVPGRRVLEAGTGSGALTHALAQAVWPNGRVLSFDFHEERVQRAQTEFKEHNLEDVVRVAQRDVVSDGFPPMYNEQNSHGVHAVMIDLPEPWTVISCLPECFVPDGGRVCVFSPCIEQVQRSYEALKAANFTDIEVLECVQRTYDLVHTVLNVPNMGQKDADRLLKGTYSWRKRSAAPENSNSGDRPHHKEKYLFPPPTKYLTSKCSSSNNHLKSGMHADGSWEAYLKPVDTGHTGYLTFASQAPQHSSEPASRSEWSDTKDLLESEQSTNEAAAC